MEKMSAMDYSAQRITSRLMELQGANDRQTIGL
jgi:hypothetical protein